MLVVTATYPKTVIEDIKNEMWCTHLIKDVFQLSFEQAEMFYSILSLNNKVIMPLNRHQVLGSLYFYVGYDEDSEADFKKEIVRYADTFYVVGDLKIRMIENTAIIKLYEINHTSICDVDVAYLRGIIIDNILKEMI